VNLAAQFRTALRKTLLVGARRDVICLYGLTGTEGVDRVRPLPARLWIGRYSAGVRLRLRHVLPGLLLAVLAFAGIAVASAITRPIHEPQTVLIRSGHMGVQR
jgi:hypothetical protein